MKSTVHVVIVTQIGTGEDDFLFHTPISASQKGVVDSPKDEREIANELRRMADALETGATFQMGVNATRIIKEQMRGQISS